MSPDPRRGYKLLDLIVAIFACAILVGLIVPAINTPRINSRRTQCSNNMRQLGLALLNYSTAHNCFPNAGTIADDPAVHQGDPTKSNLYLSIADPGKVAGGNRAWLYNWVVDIMLYLDQPDIANPWDRSVPYWWTEPAIPGQPSNAILSRTGLGVLRCPDDLTAGPNQGNLSYVVNGGFMRWPAVPVSWSGIRSSEGEKAGNGEVLQWAPAGSAWQESQAVGRKMGAMFLGTQSGGQPWDITTSPRHFSDGSSQTLLLAENTLAGYSTGNHYSNGQPTNWACPLPNFVMFLGSDDVCRTNRSAVDCLGGQLRPRLDRPNGPGWARANQPGTFENLNYGQELTVEGSFPFANSGHPGGGNFVFCDGAVRFLSDTIDGTVYARLITPAGGRLPEAIRQGPLAQEDFAESER